MRWSARAIIGMYGSRSSPRLLSVTTSSSPLIEPSGLLSSCTMVRMNFCFSMARRRTSLMSLSVRMRPRASPASLAKVTMLAM